MKSFLNKLMKRTPKHYEGVKIVNEKPPIYDAVCATFGIKPVNVFFTYGDTIYNPDGIDIPEDVIVHEKHHMKQQTTDTTPELWWGKYLRDEHFRIEQEAKCYGKQYAFVCKTMPDRNERSRFLHKLATSLSGPLYGYSVASMEACLIIKQHSGVK